MRVAVIGAGMAAAGVLEGLSTRVASTAITIFHEPEPEATHSQLESDAPSTIEDFADLYTKLRGDFGMKFPPPKTHFGAQPEKLHVQNWRSVVRGRGIGGLARFWGGSALPFTEHDLVDWPINLNSLKPYYRQAAERIGISGARDALSAIFEGEHITRPAIKKLPIIDRLEAAVASAEPCGDFELTAGISRLALNTGSGAGSCLFTGECMIGCRQGAIYDARSDIARHSVEKVAAKVWSIMPDRRLQLAVGGAKDEVVGPFDRIYLAAGCSQSTEIVMRSLGIKAGLTMSDNAVFTFPIIYMGDQLPSEKDHQYFALTNLVVACMPRTTGRRAANVQIYPIFDHLLRYYFPVRLWGALDPILKTLRRRSLIARIYLHSDYSQRYAADMQANGQVAWRLHSHPDSFAKHQDVWLSLRAGLNRMGFWVPPTLPMSHRTSSHYAATLPMEGGISNTHGEFLDGVHVADSSLFVDGPATSPSLTAYALACRIAAETV